MLNHLTESTFKSYGLSVLDNYLAKEALRLNKEIGSVEKVSFSIWLVIWHLNLLWIDHPQIRDQCAPLNRLKRAHALFALNQTLMQHESILRGKVPPGSNTDDLIKHYNCGNLNESVFNYDTSQVFGFDIYMTLFLMLF